MPAKVAKASNERAVKVFSLVLLLLAGSFVLLVRSFAIGSSRGLQGDEMYMLEDVARLEGWNFHSLIKTYALLSYYVLYVLTKFGYPLTTFWGRLPNAMMSCGGALLMIPIAMKVTQEFRLWGAARPEASDRQSLQTVRWGFALLLFWTVGLLPLHVDTGVWTRYYGYYMFFWAAAYYFIFWTLDRRSVFSTLLGAACVVLCFALSFVSHMFGVTFLPGLCILTAVAASFSLVNRCNAKAASNATPPTTSGIQWLLPLLIVVGWLIALLVSYLAWKQSVGYPEKYDKPGIIGVSNAFDFPLFWVAQMFPGETSVFWSILIFSLCVMGVFVLSLFCGWRGFLAGLGFILILFSAWLMINALSPRKAIEDRYMAPLIVFVLPVFIASFYFPFIQLLFWLAKPERRLRFFTAGIAGIMALQALLFIPYVFERSHPDMQRPLRFSVAHVPEGTPIHALHSVTRFVLRRGIPFVLRDGRVVFEEVEGQPKINELNSNKLKSLVLDLRSGKEPGALIFNAIPPALIARAQFEAMEQNFSPVIFDSYYVYTFPSFVDIPVSAMLGEIKRNEKVDRTDKETIVSTLKFYIPSRAKFQPLLTFSMHHLRTKERRDAFAAFRATEDGGAAAALLPQVRIGFDDKLPNQGEYRDEIRFMTANAPAVLFNPIELTQGWHQIHIEIPADSFDALKEVDQYSVSLAILPEPLPQNGSIPDIGDAAPGEMHSLFLKGDGPFYFMRATHASAARIPELKGIGGAPVSEIGEPLYPIIPGRHPSHRLYYWMSEPGVWRAEMAALANRGEKSVYFLQINDSATQFLLEYPRANDKWQWQGRTFETNKPAFINLRYGLRYLPEHSEWPEWPLFHKTDEFPGPVVVRRMPDGTPLSE